LVNTIVRFGFPPPPGGGTTVFARGNKLWMRLRDRPGEWKNIPTKYYVGEEAKALSCAV